MDVLRCARVGAEPAAVNCRHASCGAFAPSFIYWYGIRPRNLRPQINTNWRER
ncbi:MAG: hypothetical protein KDE51_13725 [Anaerolineales bacterium]|nr:hypothetical protein [Anaerolineales bacterium]